jgi:enamine deaminase RidA (YjgF/YER057c/UK114 family)
MSPTTSTQPRKEHTPAVTPGNMADPYGDDAIAAEAYLITTGRSFENWCASRRQRSSTCQSASNRRRSAAHGGQSGTLAGVVITRHNPATAPAVRRYSQVVRVQLGEAALLFISGLVGVDADGRLVGRGDLGAQADQVYANLAAVLASQRAALSHVVKITSFLKAGVDPGPLRARQVFPDNALPASTAVVVSSLADPDWLLEIEAIAVVPAVDKATSSDEASR